MNILLSNDDGVNAPGLICLAKALKGIGTLTVVAPEINRSAASSALTIDQPLRTNNLNNGFISVNGTPADCVHLALTRLVPEKPDIVVSGINAGVNLADDVLYSGTVAAAAEGRFLSNPSIAVSMALSSDKHQIPHYATAAKLVVQLIEQMKKKPFVAGVVLNVNVPNIAWEDLAGIKVTRCGLRHQSFPAEVRTDPRGQVYYWLGPPGKQADSGHGTDFAAIAQNYATITPLQLDLTHHNMLQPLNSWINDLET